MNYIAQYNDLLQRGEIPACRRVKAVYARLAEETRTPGQYVFDEAKADRPIAFIERFCRHSKGEWAGQPVRLELFQKAFENYNNGFVEEDYVVKSLATVRVEDALEDSCRVLEEFKPAQRKVIYEAAKADLNLDYFMNPKFSAAHMKFILEQLQENKDVTWLPVGKFHRNIVSKPLTREEISRIKMRMESSEHKDSVIADLERKKKESAKKPIKEGKTKQGGER